MANVGSLFVSLILDSTRYAAGLSETTKKTNKTVKAIQRELSGLVNFAVGAGGFYAVVRGIQAVTNAASQQEEATLRLSQTLRNNFQFTTQNLKALEDQAGALQKVTRFSDDMIESAQSQLMAIGKLNTEGVQAITPAVLDFAQAMQMDLVSAAELIAKTLGSTTNSLIRYGVQIDMTKTGAEKLAEMITQLNTRFKGQAEVEGYTTAMKTAWNVTGDFFEEIGFGITQSGAAKGMFGAYKSIVGELADNMKRAREEKERLLKYGGKPEGQGEWGIRFYTDQQLKNIENMERIDRQMQARNVTQRPPAGGETIDPEELNRSMANSERLAKDAASQRKRIMEADREALKNFREDAKLWRQSIDEYNEAIADAENRYLPFSLNNETTSEAFFELLPQKEKEALDNARENFLDFANTVQYTWSNAIYGMITGTQQFALSFENLIWRPLASVASDRASNYLVDTIFGATSSWNIWNTGGRSTNIEDNRIPSYANKRAGGDVYVQISSPTADQIVAIVDDNMRNNGILRR